MKKLLLVLCLTFVSLAQAQDVNLSHYNWKMSDVAAKGLSLQKLFDEMDRDLIKLGQSICSNRALMWTYDFKKDHDIDAGKLFLFYTNKTGNTGRTTWWYHVTPIVAYRGTEVTMDAGFTGSIKTPLRIEDWIHKFIGGTNCYEIKPEDTDLLKRMFRGQTYPENYQGKQYDCYYIKTPAGYWTPASVAMSLLGEDQNGRPVHFVRDEIEKNEVYSACKEAVTTSFGRALGAGKKKCKRFLK